MAKFSLTLIFSWLILLNSGCATSPSQNFSNKAFGYGFIQQTISTSQFELTAFTNAAYNNAEGYSKLHIYIGGDGQPFFRQHYISPDPTSKKALALELMSLDDTPSIYLGRPCYHNSRARNCDNAQWWTTHRYSEQITDSLYEAITLITQSTKEFQYNKAKPIRLIGFSGGGTLAVLLAPRLNNIKSVVTINPNLNTDAWTKHHGYSPLVGSINPYTQADLPPEINKHYLIGGQDSNVLSEHWLPRFENQQNSHVHLFEKHDHSCCWPSVWPDFIRNKMSKL